jgi:two-component system, OmpR family, sensor histidine kinase MprB
MSIRARLALGSAAAVAVAIVLASTVVYFLVQKELRAQVDRNLESSAGQISNVPRFTSFRAYPHIYVLNVPQPLSSGYFQLVDQTGNVYLPPGFVAPKPQLAVTARVRAVAKGTSGAFFYDTRLEGDDYRVYTVYSSFIPPVAVQVVQPLGGVDHELARIRLWLFLVSMVGVGIAGAAGFLVARATLRPLRDLSETAERVRATRDLSQRIAVDSSDEIGTLASTFNAMLGSLDEAQQRQRQLVQDASHELRTPLTSLRTNIEVLAAAEGLPPDERSQLLRDVITQLGEMTELITELTELARGEEQAAELEDVRLDLVAEAALRRAGRNHPEAHFEAELEETTMVGRPASLERAIVNLLDNAAKWGPPGEPIEVRLAGGELTVRDHGPGIDEEDIPHVFERFYRATTARSMPGSGLGLAIVHQVAESHGGTVEAEAAPGGGTLMRLKLPARAAVSQPFLVPR